MSKSTNIYGIDLSKDKFNIYSSLDEFKRYANDHTGYKLFARQVTKDSKRVMEAIDYYHYKQKKQPKKIRSTTNATLTIPYMISENSKDRR
jgi:phosphoserine aminotransferase